MSIEQTIQSLGFEKVGSQYEKTVSANEAYIDGANHAKVYIDIHENTAYFVPFNTDENPSNGIYENFASIDDCLKWLAA